MARYLAAYVVLGSLVHYCHYLGLFHRRLAPWGKLIMKRMTIANVAESARHDGTVMRQA